jgi:hypothetical protein
MKHGVAGVAVADGRQVEHLEEGQGAAGLADEQGGDGHMWRGK